MCLQGILVQFGKNAFHCSKGGLTIQQWGMCLLMGSLTFFVSLFAKCIPVPECNNENNEEEKEIILNANNMDDEKNLILYEE
jgi:hypothetical protein